MNIHTAQVVQSEQVFVCDDCGTHSPKFCTCINSTAHAEELLKKKEANRQAARKYRQEKAEQNQQPRHNDAIIENIEEFPAGTESDSPEVCWRRGLLYRCQNAAGEAKFEDWSEFTIDAELVNAAKLAAEAWRKLAAYLERLER